MEKMKLSAQERSQG
uniref:Uncharacterized protein n=1 Tax=Anguilla anguilla TaxID=7936 RepID=A0A0E9Q0T0_ANGAN